MPKGKRASGVVPSRWPCGRLQGSETSGTTPAEAKRLRDAALRGMASPEWATELGRLFLTDKITPTAYEAGKHWARLAETYHRATGAPPQAPSASVFSGAGRNSPPDPDSDAGRRQQKREERTVASMTRALAVLYSLGVPVVQVVRRVCEENQVPTSEVDLQNLITGLSSLAELWGLDRVQKKRA